jgi:hypothetical protein
VCPFEIVATEQHTSCLVWLHLFVLQLTLCGGVLHMVLS